MFQYKEGLTGGEQGLRNSVLGPAQGQLLGWGVGGEEIAFLKATFVA